MENSSDKAGQLTNFYPPVSVAMGTSDQKTAWWSWWFEFPFYILLWSAFLFSHPKLAPIFSPLSAFDRFKPFVQPLVHCAGRKRFWGLAIVEERNRQHLSSLNCSINAFFQDCRQSCGQRRCSFLRPQSPHGRRRARLLQDIIGQQELNCRIHGISIQRAQPTTGGLKPGMPLLQLLQWLWLEFGPHFGPWFSPETDNPINQKFISLVASTQHVCLQQRDSVHKWSWLWMLLAAPQETHQRPNPLNACLWRSKKSEAMMKPDNVPSKIRRLPRTQREPRLWVQAGSDLRTIDFRDHAFDRHQFVLPPSWRTEGLDVRTIKLGVFFCHGVGARGAKHQKTNEKYHHKSGFRNFQGSKRQVLPHKYPAGSAHQVKPATWSLYDERKETVEPWAPHIPQWKTTAETKRKPSPERHLRGSAEVAKLCLGRRRVAK